MSAFTIRNAHDDDFDRIFELWLENQAMAIGQAIEQNQIAAFRAELLHTFSRSHSHYYVAVSDDNNIIGWQSLTPLFSNPVMDSHISQSSTYVDKAFFRLNIAHALFEHAYRAAKNSGISHIYGWVQPNNKAIHEIASHFKHYKHSVPGSSNGKVPEFNLYVVVVE
ncbi:GNAT family N-acetyltransferase [Hymenobacter gummosus]|uniref:GNAT family N-acetyltransferase n=1 Tax=Hymenobacter gummosus TaxID=1776032 RepID=A0A3S0H7X1_9BACT|nr:GNAT family N-acetyltransferase [Hymenobacter gummosus]RTQ52531.1 GNAT family N-acetyltransferase [Hymenobacter gummosus]